MGALTSRPAEEAEEGEEWVSTLLRCWSIKKVLTQKWNSLLLGLLRYLGLDISFISRFSFIRRLTFETRPLASVFEKTQS